MRISIGVPFLQPANIIRAIASVALLSACTAGRAEEPEALAAPKARLGPFASSLKPAASFAQFGASDEVTTGTAGIVWNLPWTPGPSWNVYVEASLSRWQSRGGQPSDHGVLTQVALVPVLRWRPGEGQSPWYVEGGIGATVTSSVYRSTDTRFSTAFNFGDHVGVGYSFGAARKNEIALRAEHFSNAGIKHPNPGKNFLELRYVRHFD